MVGLCNALPREAHMAGKSMPKSVLIRMLRAALTKRGVGKENIDAAFEEVKGRRAKPVQIPRKVIDRIRMRLKRPGDKVVVTLGINGLSVWTLESFKSRVKSMLKNRQARWTKR